MWQNWIHCWGSSRRNHYQRWRPHDRHRKSYCQNRTNYNFSQGGRSNIPNSRANFRSIRLQLVYDGANNFGWVQVSTQIDHRRRRDTICLHFRRLRHRCIQIFQRSPRIKRLRGRSCHIWSWIRDQKDCIERWCGSGNLDDFDTEIHRWVVQLLKLSYIRGTTTPPNRRCRRQRIPCSRIEQ